MIKNFKRFKNEKYNALPPIQKVFKAEAIGEDSYKLTIYGNIGESWWGESITATDVEKELSTITAGTIHVHINSYGGDVFDGITIKNQLKNHPAKIIAHIDGVGASAASIIPMGADEIIMENGSMMMIHEGSTMAWGNKQDIRKALNALEGIDKSIADIYMTRFKGEKSEIETMIVNETWFTASEAVDAGLADRVNEQGTTVDPEQFKNNVLARFRNQQPSQQKNILDKFRRNL